MDLVGGAVGAWGIDGIPQQQAAVPSDADPVGCEPQSFTQISVGQSSAFISDIARVWREHNQSHFRRAVTGVHRLFKQCGGHFLRRARFESEP